MASRKQRLIFLEMDRNDPYSVMDIAKIADIVVVSMSCKKTNVNGIKQDPFEHAKAIDELGYRALSLIRSQGMPSLIGVLQHLEFVSSSKQSYVKKLFQRIYESEFTENYKFMYLNKSSEALQNTDSNALLRQIAVQFPDDITWR
jgi:pre-rRNA-processing protein TSR1